MASSEVSEALRTVARKIREAKPELTEEEMAYESPKWAVELVEEIQDLIWGEVGVILDRVADELEESRGIATITKTP